jgi:hypothetical protein
MNDALHEPNALLRSYEQPRLANTSCVAMGYAVARDERIRPGLCSDEWRGDSGSMAAIEPAVPGGFTRDARSDSRRLRAPMLALHAGIQNHCIPPPEARLMANQFNTRLASHNQVKRIRYRI